MPALLGLARAGTAGQKVRAAAALRNLASSDRIAAQLVAAGIGPLVALVRSGSNAAKEQAAGTLGNLALLPTNRAALHQAGAVDALSQLAIEGSTGAQKEVAEAALAFLISR